ncbi:glycoside hydrolase family 88/105 protein [Crossiella sp. CA198]|uniref:glycoside hydrolase family 88/105 protein n=1 Tax=Crossiella sp. CA198 TaxID=3455607 RepID=UPI003F8D409D
MSRGSVLALLLSAALAASPVTPVLAAPATDLSRAVVDSTLRRHSPATLGGWAYTQGLYLHGQYLVYKRTGDRRYLDYLRAWTDRFVDAEGGMSIRFDNLDAIRAGTLLIVLHAETGDPRYKRAADRIRGAITGYPRTSDGGMWHNNGFAGQLWADGVYMAQPFLAMYGKAYGDERPTHENWAYTEALDNLAVYFRHLNAPNGLLFHAYDEQGDTSWSQNPAKRSGEHWARAIGWFGMAAVDLLDILPGTHPRRGELIGYVRHLAQGFARYQDRDTGRWFQVVDKAADPRNWTETSASAMYTYLLSKGVQQGYLDRRYLVNAQRGYRGVLAKVVLDSRGVADVQDIVEGTGVGDAGYYYQRKRITNDPHGLGAFLIMNEQLAPGR